MTADNGVRGIMPTFASRTGAGIKFYQNDLIHSGTKFSLIATEGLKGESKIAVDFNGPKLGHKMLRARFNAAYVNLAAEHIFGFGPDSDNNDEFTYGYARKSGDAFIGFNYRDNFYANAAIRIELNKVKKSNDLDDWSLFDETNWPATFGKSLPGLYHMVDLTSFRVEIGLDTRDKHTNPAKGLDVYFSSGIYDQRDGFKLLMKLNQ